MSLIKIAIADDHQLVRQGVSRILTESGHEVVIQADTGKDLLEQLKHKSEEIEIVLLDINMPEMGGVEAAQAISDNYPKLKVIAMSALDDDLNVIRMLRAGARAYVLKSASQEELNRAVRDVESKGYHFSDMVSGKLVKTVQSPEPNSNVSTGVSFSDRDVEFMRLFCTDMTNTEIADKMCVSPRTTEGWRKNLCEKLHVKTRVGIVLWALRSGLVK